MSMGCGQWAERHFLVLTLMSLNHPSLSPSVSRAELHPCHLELTFFFAQWVNNTTSTTTEQQLLCYHVISWELPFITIGYFDDFLRVNALVVMYYIFIVTDNIFFHLWYIFLRTFIYHDQ